MRNARESQAPTIWQLETFVAVVETGSWEQAAERLRIDKFQGVKTVERLAAKLGIDDLLPTIDGRPHATDRDTVLAQHARDLLNAYGNLRATASGLGQRGVLLRVAAFPAHIAHFLGAAVGLVEGRHESVKFEFDDLHSVFRKSAGVALRRRVQDKLCDFAIAPVSKGPEKSLRSKHLYTWRLVAAVREGHPLRARAGQHPGYDTIDVAELSRFDLVTAPPGHASHRLLEHHGALDYARVDMTSDDPDVLVALGAASDRVPIIPSDSRVQYGDAWMHVVAKGKPIGGAYAAFWREGPAEPEPLTALARELADTAFAQCEPLRSRLGGAE